MNVENLMQIKLYEMADEILEMPTRNYDVFFNYWKSCEGLPIDVTVDVYIFRHDSFWELQWGMIDYTHTCFNEKKQTLTTSGYYKYWEPGDKEPEFLDEWFFIVQIGDKDGSTWQI